MGLFRHPDQGGSDIDLHVALVADTGAVSAREITRVAALDKQVTRGFGPLWGVLATAEPVFSLEDVPVGYWSIVLRDRINASGADGFHKDRFGQPFARVSLTDSWSLTASHECLEMLADPFGDRIIPGHSIKSGEGRVSYLVEVCDPPESEEFAYTVNDVLVSDFITPSFYDPVAVPGFRYSFTGAVKRPRQVLEGGYISWRNQTNERIVQLIVRTTHRQERQERIHGPGSVVSIFAQREGVRRQQDGTPRTGTGPQPTNQRLRSAIEVEQNNKRAREQAAELLRKELETLEHAEP